jgi:hypothetical protein
LWADGFYGTLPHIENRAGFVVTSPAGSATKFKIGRGWRFRMVSHRDTSFAEDMGYHSKDGWLPGVSVFRKQGGRICRVFDNRFGPGDDFCAVVASSLSSDKSPPPRWALDGGGCVQRHVGNADGSDASLRSFRQTVRDDFAALQHQGNAF